jgi:FkbM family methyltransferase
MNAFDIGANIGYYTKFLSSRVGATGKVIAVEPMPRALLLLTRNKTANAEIVPAAIGPAAGRAELHEMSSLDTSFVDFRRANGAVSVVTIDELSNRYGPPDLIKLDVEGAELQALEGACETLTSASPPLVMFEYIFTNAANFGAYNLHDILRRFPPTYETFRVVAPGNLAPFGQPFPGATNDYLAVPGRKHANLLGLLSQETHFGPTTPSTTSRV